MNIIIGSSGFLGSYLCKILDNTLQVNSENYDSFIQNFDYNTIWTNEIDIISTTKIYNKEKYFIYICADCKNNTKIINDLITLNKSNIYILFSSASIYFDIKKNTYNETDSTNEKTDDNYVNTIKINEELFNK